FKKGAVTELDCKGHNSDETTANKGYNALFRLTLCDCFGHHEKGQKWQILWQMSDCYHCQRCLTHQGQWAFPHGAGGGVDRGTPAVELGAPEVDVGLRHEAETAAGHWAVRVQSWRSSALAAEREACVLQPENPPQTSLRVCHRSSFPNKPSRSVSPSTRFPTALVL